MDDDPFQLSIRPAGVLELHDLETDRVDLSVTWEAAEALASPDLEIRIKGVDRLLEANALCRSLLVTYLFVTRLTETDIQLRSRVVAALVDLFNLNGSGNQVRPEIVDGLAHYLSGLRTRQIFALLQVVAFDPSAEPMVAALLSYCSFAGGHLADIAADRRAPLAIRKQAVHFIGRVGFLDAEPALTRMTARLESRSNGRWNDAGENDESSLLPLIQHAIAILRAP
jgi:hypothetical protein